LARVGQLVPRARHDGPTAVEVGAVADVVAGIAVAEAVGEDLVHDLVPDPRGGLVAVDVPEVEVDRRREGMESRLREPALRAAHATHGRRSASRGRAARAANHPSHSATAVAPGDELEGVEALLVVRFAAHPRPPGARRT
jgi:hypothetical protein